MGSAIRRIAPTSTNVDEALANADAAIRSIAKIINVISRQTYCTKQSDVLHQDHQCDEITNVIGSQTYCTIEIVPVPTE